ncbi:hypothetical protein PRZ48_004127 [Zasmidium cellare]|uniref:N-acetyltransferase domain-containing protein n=1 Tax=Zasmidium cellare TaxID=395010 RepID=A0ABR0EWZ7_ZASCE|nr:hypothetical protein PRZ48_004127 [Zasmidium cellare]
MAPKLDAATSTALERQEEFYLFVLARVRMFFVKPSIRMMVAEKLDVGVKGQTAEILGFAAWDAMGDQNPINAEWTRESRGWLNTLEQKLADAEVVYHRYARNTIFDYPLFNQARQRLHDAYEHDTSFDNNLHLQFLMVKPEWQKGHGIGHRLLQWGLDVADKVKLPVLIESSLAGYNFYLRHGFKLLKMIRVDFVPEKAYDMPVIVYDPR